MFIHLLNNPVLNCKHYTRHVIKVNIDTFAHSENLRLEKTHKCHSGQGSVGNECRSAADGAEQCVQEFRSGTFKLCQVGERRAYFRQKEINNKIKNQKIYDFYLCAFSHIFLSLLYNQT